MQASFLGKILTVTFDDSEVNIISWMHDNYSGNEFNLLLTNFLNQKKAQMGESNKEKYWKHLSDNPDILAVVDEMVSKKPGK